MGNTPSVNKVNFEDIQYAIKQSNSCLLINTLNPNEQSCLIKKLDNSFLTRFILKNFEFLSCLSEIINTS